MAFFLTRKVHFQVEGISPRTSQIQKSDEEANISHDTSTEELKSRARESNAKSKSSNSTRGQKCKNQHRHDLHARRIPEKKPHLKTVKTAGTRRKRAKSGDKSEVFKLCVHPQRKHGSSPNSSFDNTFARDVKTPTAEEIKLIDDISQKLPEKALFDILCGHFAKVGSHTRDEFLRRAIKWRRGTVHGNNNSHCIICYLQRLAAQPIQTNYDRIISSGFSPRSHYDRYSREVHPGKQTECHHDLLSICKKADLMLKNTQERKPPPPPRSSALELNPSNFLLSLRETPDSEYSDNNADRLLQIYMQPRQRDIHHQCQPRLPPFLLNSGRLPPEMAVVYKRKALRGGFLKKETPSEKDKNRTDAELTKQVTYPISSLGLSFTIPSHNKNLSFIPKPATSKDPIQSIVYRPSIRILPPIRRNIAYLSM